MKNTFYANTRHGFVTRITPHDYKHWTLIGRERWSNAIGANVVEIEISFHHQGNLRRRPKDAVLYEYGDVSLVPGEGLEELRKNDRGRIILSQI